jgi:hypothetical protein
MGLSMAVGQLLDDLLEGATAYLARASDAALTDAAQAELLNTWAAAPEWVDDFDALNAVSWVAFTDHTARLEGLKDTEEAMTGSRWRHLPYWVYGCWLPVRSDTIYIYEDYLFVGSAYGLLANLAEIRAASPHDLGVTPPHYALMRTDPRVFYRLNLEAFDEKTMMQWLWRSFFDAASLSIARNVPMWCGG